MPKTKHRGHGKGSIFYREDKKLWVTQVTVNGKKRQLYGKTRREVQEKKQALEAEIAKGTYAEPNKVLFGDWLTRWLTVYVKPKVRESTFANYDHAARTHILPELGKIPLQSLRTDTIQEFYNRKAQSGGRLETLFIWELPKKEMIISGFNKVSRLEDAMKWLQEILANGPREKRGIETMAKAKDIPLTTLRTAKNRLSVKWYKKQGENGTGGLSPRILHLMHQLINGSLKQAVRQKLFSNNPAEWTTRPGIKHKEMSILNARQINQYLEAARDDRLYAAFFLELSSGLRRGELLGLSWDCIDLTKGTLTVKRSLSRVRLVDKGTSELIFSDPKTDSGKRIIPLLPEVVQELKTHKARQAQEKLITGQAYQDSGLVFTTPTGSPIEPRNFHRKHTEILKKAGLPHVRLHDLRHYGKCKFMGSVPRKCPISTTFLLKTLPIIFCLFT